MHALEPKCTPGTKGQQLCCVDITETRIIQIITNLWPFIRLDLHVGQTNANRMIEVYSIHTINTLIAKLFMILMHTSM